MFRFWVYLVKIKDARFGRALALFWLFLLIVYVELDRTTRSVSAREQIECGIANQSTQICHSLPKTQQPLTGTASLPPIPKTGARELTPRLAPPTQIVRSAAAPVLGEALDWWKSISVTDLSSAQIVGFSAAPDLAAAIDWWQSVPVTDLTSAQTFRVAAAPVLTEALDWWMSVPTIDLTSAKIVGFESAPDLAEALGWWESVPVAALPKTQISRSSAAPDLSKAIDWWKFVPVTAFTTATIIRSASTADLSAALDWWKSVPVTDLTSVQIVRFDSAPDLAEALDWWKSVPVSTLPTAQTFRVAAAPVLTEALDWWKSVPVVDLSSAKIVGFESAPTLAVAIDWWKSVPVTDLPNQPPANPVKSLAISTTQGTSIEKFPPQLTPEQRSIDKPPGLPTTPQVKPIEVAPTVVPTVPKPTPGYLIAPRSLELNRVDPTVTQIAINDIPTTHRSRYEITGGIESGDRRTTDAALNTTGLYSPSVVESVSSDRVYRIQYYNVFSQVRAIRQQREIITNTITPETALGMRQQISFVGDCLVAPSGTTVTSGGKQLCSYVPAFITDTTSIDPKQLIPRAFFQPSGFGAQVSQASMDAMRAPGFQAGANGEQFGIDLYFPKVGTRSGNSQSQTITLDRFESNQSVGMAAFGRVKQVIVTNGKEVALGRTIRGFNYISGDRNSGWMAGIQAASELLPDFEPSVAPGKKGRSTTLDRTLILAANNNRVPESSFTAYYAGVGRGNTPNGKDILAANYHGVWVGFSPVIERRIKSETSFQVTGAERVISFTGGEGGADSNTELAATIDDTSFSSVAVSNSYAQAYLTRYERDINTFGKTSLQERTNYYPHISLTGNITSADSILRYYGGLIFNPNPNTVGTIGSKIYGGVDFTKVESNGLSYNLAAIGYTNPDPEYYSRISGSISKTFSLGRNPGYNIALSSGLTYAFDNNSLFDNFNFRSGNSFFNVGAKANLGNISFGVTYFVPNAMPNPINSLLSLSSSWQITSGINLSAFYTPVNDNATRAPLGVSASIRLGKDINDPTLSLSWTQNQTDFGADPSGNKLKINDNVVAAYIRFGAPGNPFGK
jgi:hypothetical protein